jgi:hypothetical protein
MAATAIIVLAATLGQPLANTRAVFRYRLYAATVGPHPAFVMHPNAPEHMAAWPIWRALDDATPHRIAVTAGFADAGHYTYRSPLMGSRLQNEVVYVPISRDGEIFDYQLGAEEIARRADESAWIERLRAKRIDTVVTIGPPPPESAWMARHPALFEPIASNPQGTDRAFRFYPDGGRRSSQATRPPSSTASTGAN